jgi:hypothetical protein
VSDPVRDMAARRVVLSLAGTERVRVTRGHAYRREDDEDLVIDVYAPEDRRGPRPAVVCVMGYPDRGMRAFFGCNAKDMGSYDSWARLCAVTGITAVTYACRQPLTDARLVLAEVRRHAAAWEIDASRMAVWSCSGNVPAALAVLAAEGDSIAAAALLYGYMLDLDGATDVANAASTFKFQNPGVAGGVHALPVVPTLVVRAAADEMPGLNASIDRLVAASEGRPITLIDHPGPHAFDVAEASEASRQTIRTVLEFLAATLTP